MEIPLVLILFYCLVEFNLDLGFLCEKAFDKFNIFDKCRTTKVFSLAFVSFIKLYFFKNFSIHLRVVLFQEFFHSSKLFVLSF